MSVLIALAYNKEKVMTFVGVKPRIPTPVNICLTPWAMYNCSFQRLPRQNGQNKPSLLQVANKSLVKIKYPTDVPRGYQRELFQVLKNIFRNQTFFEQKFPQGTVI